MSPQDLIEYWKRTSWDDFDTSEKLFEAKKYHHALFFCHLALEKLLKGLAYKNTNDHAPPIHDLIRLAKHGLLILTPQMEKDLSEINTWNIRARYDNLKFEFYKKATKEFSTKWFTKVKEIYTWIQNQF